MIKPKKSPNTNQTPQNHQTDRRCLRFPKHRVKDISFLSFAVVLTLNAETARPNVNGQANDSRTRQPAAIYEPRIPRRHPSRNRPKSSPSVTFQGRSSFNYTYT
jgi:hypothetical protein